VGPSAPLHVMTPGCELAALDVTDEPVLRSVERVAGRERRRVQRGVLRRRDEARLVLVSGLPHPHLPERVAGQVRRHPRDGNDVVVVGIPLRGTERGNRPAAALGHHRIRGLFLVERLDERLRGDGHLVRRSIAEILDPLGMIQRVARGRLRGPCCCPRWHSPNGCRWPAVPG